MLRILDKVEEKYFASDTLWLVPSNPSKWRDIRERQ